MARTSAAVWQPARKRAVAARAAKRTSILDMRAPANCCVPWIGPSARRGKGSRQFQTPERCRFGWNALKRVAIFQIRSLRFSSLFFRMSLPQNRCALLCDML
nr:hypothetical protein SHINE37_40339 [Rhizobiaceae bacterium]